MVLFLVAGVEAVEAVGAGNYDDMAAHYNVVAIDGWDYTLDKGTLVFVAELQMRARTASAEPEVVESVDENWVYHAQQIAPGEAAVGEAPGEDFRRARTSLLGDFQNGGWVPCSCGRIPV